MHGTIKFGEFMGPDDIAKADQSKQTPQPSSASITQPTFRSQHFRPQPSQQKITQSPAVFESSWCIPLEPHK